MNMLFSRIKVDKSRFKQTSVIIEDIINVSYCYDGINSISIKAIEDNLVLFGSDKDKGCKIVEFNTIDDWKRVLYIVQVFYYNLHNLGFRYFWFQTKNRFISYVAKCMFSVTSFQGNIYVIDLDRSFYHSNIIAP